MSAPEHDGMQLEADVTVTAFNKYPISFAVPELAFELLIPNCDPISQIMVASAFIKPMQVKAKSNVEFGARGFVEKIPDSLVRDCPQTGSSPLDTFLGNYMHGKNTTVYVRGGKQLSVPGWVGNILSSISVPIPFPGHSLDSSIKNFSFEDVDFTLPSPFAEPGSPDANPKVSGTILVTATVPSEMNFEVNVTNVRATSNVFYHKEKFGELNVDEWQPANSTMVDNKDHGSELMVQSQMVDVPLNITDSDVFSKVVQEVLFGNDHLILNVEASVDVMVDTVLGQLVLKGVPAEGKIPVKRPSSI